jgi:hypothetical protein
MSSENSENAPTDVTALDGVRPMVLEFIDLSNSVKQARTQIKLMNERKKELEGRIRERMSSLGIRGFTTAEGNIHVYESKTAKAPAKEDIVTLVAGKIGDERLAEEVMEIIYSKENRVPVATEKIKVIPKRRRD